MITEKYIAAIEKAAFDAGKARHEDNQTGTINYYEGDKLPYYPEKFKTFEDYKKSKINIMKNTIVILLSLFLFACNSKDTTPKEAPNDAQEIAARTIPTGSNFTWVDTVNGWEITITAKDSTVTKTESYTYSYQTKKVDTTWRQLGNNPPPPPPPPVPSSYTLVYSTGYDTKDDLDPFGHGQLGGGSLSTTIYKTSPGSFKSVPKEVSSGIRSEVQYDAEQTPKEGIVEYDVYYDNFFSNSGHSLQWHPSTGGGSGTGLYHKNGQLQFVTVKSGTSGTNVGQPFSVSTKTWHHIKLTYKFGSAGYIKVELDGVEKVNSNVQMGDGSSPYLKVGVNMWVNQTSVVYYDNLKVYKKQ